MQSLHGHKRLTQPYAMTERFGARVVAGTGEQWNSLRPQELPEWRPGLIVARRGIIEVVVPERLPEQRTGFDHVPPVEQQFRDPARHGETGRVAAEFIRARFDVDAEDANRALLPARIARRDRAREIPRRLDFQRRTASEFVKPLVTRPVPSR